MTIKDFILLICIIALAVGYLFEDRIAAWERRAAAKVKRFILQLIAKRSD